jgi:hypothetical protein
MLTLSVVSVQAVVTAANLGIKAGEARFSDGATVPFRVLSLDPLSVLLPRKKHMPRHLQAVEEWLAKYYDSELLSDGWRGRVRSPEREASMLSSEHSPAPSP